MLDQFDFAVIYTNLPFLLDGLGLSFLLTALAICGGLGLGVLLAIARQSRNLPLKAISTVYVNAFRSVPLLLVIFWFYFMVPLIIGQSVGAFYSALIAFSLFEAAYYSEIIRAGLQSVSRGQVQAGLALGLTRRQNFQYVILPQALRNMIPVLITQAIILFQDTSLVFVVSLQDFMTSADIVAKREGRLVEMYVFAALVYLAICLTGSQFVKYLQRTKTV
jgi:glutamate/aspartate transport system permease protein